MMSFLTSITGFFMNHPPFFLICIIGQNRQKFKVHKKSVIYVKKLIIMLYPRWPPLLKIEISSNGQKLLYFKPESAQI
jgi:hypothetical protein